MHSAHQSCYNLIENALGFSHVALDEGETVSWTPAVWKSYKLPRAVGSTLAAEAQAMSHATGTVEWTPLLLAEALACTFEVREFAAKLNHIKTLVVTDCKSLYDHLISVSSPTAIEDRRTSIDVVIIRQSIQRTCASVRWTPTDRMLADSLTKDAGDPTDLLRACIRSGTYQISLEETLLEMQALEKQRRLAKKKDDTSQLSIHTNICKCSITMTNQG